MSHTYRKPAHWVKNALERELNERHPYSAKFFGKLVAKIRGQDGTRDKRICFPSNNSPTGRGYAEIGGKLGKRFAKRAVARIHRRRGSKEAQHQMAELYWDQQDEAWLEQCLDSDWNTTGGRDEDDSWSYEDSWGSSTFDRPQDLAIRDIDAGILMNMLRRHTVNDMINTLRCLEHQRLHEEKQRDLILVRSLSDILA